jgi:hypothetical protein
MKIFLTGYVYTLWNNDESDVFYVGATTNPSERLTAHKQRAKVWDISVKSKVMPMGINYNMTIIEEIEFEIEDRSQLYDAEKYWIGKFLSYGFKLKNKQLHNSIDLKNIPDDVMAHVSKIHKDVFNEKTEGRSSLEYVIFKIIQEHKEYSETRKSKKE